MNAEGYSEWIRLVAEFTLKSLHSWKVCIYDYLICSLKELDYMFCSVNDRIYVSDILETISSPRELMSRIAKQTN